MTTQQPWIVAVAPEDVPTIEREANRQKITLLTMVERLVKQSLWKTITALDIPSKTSFQPLGVQVVFPDRSPLVFRFSSYEVAVIEAEMLQRRQATQSDQELPAYEAVLSELLQATIALYQRRHRFIDHQTPYRFEFLGGCAHNAPVHWLTGELYYRNDERIVPELEAFCIPKGTAYDGTYAAFRDIGRCVSATLRLLQDIVERQGGVWEEVHAQYPNIMLDDTL
jgi:hypothetical protein